MKKGGPEIRSSLSFPICFGLLDRDHRGSAGLSVYGNNQRIGSRRQSGNFEIHLREPDELRCQSGECNIRHRSVDGRCHIALMTRQRRATSDRAGRDWVIHLARASYIGNHVTIRGGAVFRLPIVPFAVIKLIAIAATLFLELVSLLARLVLSAEGVKSVMTGVVGSSPICTLLDVYDAAGTMRNSNGANCQGLTLQ